VAKASCGNEAKWRNEMAISYHQYQCIEKRNGVSISVKNIISVANGQANESES
jgi:hypothetical protein